MMPQDISLTSHHFQEIVHTRPDWQINVQDECKQTRPAASLITTPPLLYGLVKRFAVLKTANATSLTLWAAGPPYRRN